MAVSRRERPSYGELFLAGHFLPPQVEYSHRDSLVSPLWTGFLHRQAAWPPRPALLLAEAHLLHRQFDLMRMGSRPDVGRSRLRNRTGPGDGCEAHGTMYSTGFRSKSRGPSLFVAAGSSPERNSRYAQKSAMWPMSNEVRYGYNVVKVCKGPGSATGRRFRTATNGSGIWASGTPHAARSAEPARRRRCYRRGRPAGAERSMSSPIPLPHVLSASSAVFAVNSRRS
jgi:hypothetical protein